jgi:hypothetical protein
MQEAELARESLDRRGMEIPVEADTSGEEDLAGAEVYLSHIRLLPGEVTRWPGRHVGTQSMFCLTNRTSPYDCASPAAHRLFPSGSSS